MHIGLLTACYTPVINGVTRMVDLYAQQLRRAGHTVTIVVPGPPHTADDEHVIRVPALPLGRSGYHAAYRYPTAVQKRIRQMDILHAHHLFMSLEFAHRYRAPGTPIVYTNHTRYDTYTAVHLPLVGPLLGDTLMRHGWPQRTRLADAVIAPTADIAATMRRFGVTAPIHIIANGIDIDRFTNAAPLDRFNRFGWTAAHTVLVYVGRLSPEKQVDVLLRQFARARATAPHLRLLLVGDGPARADLMRLIGRLRLQTAVQLTGAIPYARVPAHLVTADAFVTASESEVHPLTVLEALAAGRPVIAPAAPGIARTVPDDAGHLTPTADRLAHGMIRFARQTADQADMRIAARRAADRYRIQKTTRHTLSLYEALLSSSPPTSTREKEIA